MKRLFFLLILSAALSFAQPETATLRGTVLNTSGEPLPNVPVVLTEMTTNGDIRQLVTGGSGDFDAPFLRAGLYKLTIEFRGYQNYSADQILLEPGQVRLMEPKLVAGSADDTTEARWIPTLIDTQTGSVRNVIDNKVRWDDAPVVDKIPSPFPLLATVPGVQGNGLGLVISGMSGRNRQTWALDGIADDATPGEYANPNFFELMQVTTANPGPNTYRPAGFDLISKRGSPDFHGLVYYKRENSAFDARPYFAPQKAGYKIGEQGGEFGGHLISNYTYFYGGWIYQTNPFGQALFADVPTAAMRTGDFSQYLDPQNSPSGKVQVIRDPRNGLPFPNNQIPTNRLSTVANNVLNQYYPAPNIGAANAFLQNYTWSHPFGPDLFKGNWPFLRIDQKLANQNNVYVRFMYSLVSNVAAGSIGELLTSTQARKYKSLVVSDTETFSPTLVNQFTLGHITDFVRQGEAEGKYSPIAGDSVINNIGLQGANLNGYSTQAFPTMAITGFTGLSMTYAGGYSKNVAQNDGLTTYQDQVAWSKDKHALKLGVDYTRFHWLEGTVPQLNYGAFTFTGQLSGIGFADFLLGYPATSSRLLDPKLDDKLHQVVAGAYLTDSFRATSRLTVDYGVRWDYFRSPVYDDGYMYNWDPVSGNVIVAPGTFTSVSTLYPAVIKVVVGGVVPKPKITNFQPHVSAAYRLSNTMVLRGGFSQFTDGGGYGASGALNDTNGPFRIQETYINSVNAAGVVAYAMPDPFPATVSPTLTGRQTITAIPMKTDEGVIRQYSATLEREWNGLGLRASYIGSRGAGINYTLETDKPRASATPFSTARLPYPQFGSAIQTRTDGQWHYNSALVEARKQLATVWFDTSFTWANNQANYLNTFDPYNVTSHWSNDAATRRKYFVATGMWALPIGKGKRFVTDPGLWTNRLVSNWSLQAIATWASGQYYSPLFTGPDPANASPTQVTALPDCIGNPDSGARTTNRWFNPSAFAVPPPSAGRYGTCGVDSLEGYPIRVVHGSASKRFPIGETFSLTFTAQVSNVFNTANFTVPNNNISLPGAGTFTASSAVADYFPERQGTRQISVKVRLMW